MKIYYEDGPNGVRSYTIDLDGSENPNFRNILEGWLDALEFHEIKSRDYSERDEPGVWNLGLRGEWPGVTRKIQKLHKIVWKGKDVLFEGGQEIMMDLMGALGLLLHEQKKIGDKYSAGWRDNHRNKPTFGPGPGKPPMSEDDIKIMKVKDGEIHFFPPHTHRFFGGRCTVCTIPQEAYDDKPPYESVTSGKCDKTKSGRHEFIGRPRMCSGCGVPDSTDWLGRSGG
jgi:hypothetical protein